MSDDNETALKLGGAKRKNGHKMNCDCHICDNIKNKAKRGGYREDAEKAELKKKGLSSHQDKLVNLDVDINPDPGLDIPSDLRGKASEIKKYIEENKHRSGRNKSNLLYDAARAYLEGVGFRTRFKPNAWAATVAADFHVRGAKKKNRKGRSVRKNQVEL